MYIFYDTETTGLDQNFSQILQIALVFTDDRFNIVESKKLECRCSPWVVPSPGAMLTTGFVPDEVRNNKLSHYEMMQEIDSWVRSKHWPVVFVGYNSMGFDEGVLAQNLHQNLLDPDLTRLKDPHGDSCNDRSDVMLMVQAAMLYKPGVLKLERTNGTGSPSLSLINVAEQNGVQLSAEEAHDAMNDIKATIGVAKVIKEKLPEIWDHLATLSTAKGVDDFLSKNEIFTRGWVDYGKPKNGVFSVLGLVEGSSSKVILFDMSYDPAAYQGMTIEQIKESMKPARYGEPEKKQPFVIIDKDQQPILMPLNKSSKVMPKDFDLEVARARAQSLKADLDFQKRASEATRIVTPTGLPELQIGSFSAPDVQNRAQAWMDDFNSAPTWQEKADVLGDFYKRFPDEFKNNDTVRRFAKFAGRIIFEHAPECIGRLGGQKITDMKKHIAARILNADVNVPYMTVAKARRELEKIEKERTDPTNKKWKHIKDSQIRSLRLYYTAIEKEYASYALQLPLWTPPQKNNPPKP